MMEIVGQEIRAFGLREKAPYEEEKEAILGLGLRGLRKVVKDTYPLIHDILWIGSGPFHGFKVFKLPLNGCELGLSR